MNKCYISAVVISCSVWVLLITIATICALQDSTTTATSSEMTLSATAPPSPTGIFPISVPSVPRLVEPDVKFPCAGGNWYGIQPGVTTEQSLFSWLETSSCIDRDSVVESYRNIYPGGIEIHEFELSLDGYEQISIWVISGTVASLHSPVGITLDLGTVVSALGEPEYVSASFDWQGNDCIYGLTVDYPALGITFFADIYNQCDIILTDSETGLDSGPLTPDILVRSVECYHPGSLLESLEALGWSPQQANFIANQAQKWPGWGRIQLIEPGN